MSQGELNENRNLMQTKREKLALFWFSVRTKTVKIWPIDLFALKIAARSVRKVHRITGLWQPSVHSDVAF